MRRLLARWRARNVVVDQCCGPRCGAPLRRRDRHVVTEVCADDARLAGGTAFGGTAMSASFGRCHCPGGCDRGCVAS